MVSCLSTLSTEVQLAIIGHIDQAGDQATLRNWSSTCSTYRALLAPYIFKSITLRNTEKSAFSVDAITRGRDVAYIKELHYLATAPCDSGCDDEELEHDSPNTAVLVFPESVHKVLSSLDRFPNLHTLSIDIHWHFEEEWDEELPYWVFEDDESDEDVKEAEEKQDWRALVAKTYAALSENPHLHIKALEIRQFMFRNHTPFCTDFFHDLLGTLERFGLSLRGGESACWAINHLDGYVAFVPKLDEYFFNHLTSVRHVSLRADKSGPIGLQGQGNIPLVLNPRNMPCLQFITLEYIFICEELLDFLVAHADTLEVLSMRDCYGSVDVLVENGIYWERFFQMLHSAKPRAMNKLEVLPLDLPIDGRFEDPAGETTEACRKILEQDKRRRLFAYASLDDKYGTLYDEESENLNSFFKGEDQEAYDNLMLVVDENKRYAISQGRV